jgi:hypothetical protein
MRHVVVVTRNPALTVGLTHHGYDCADVKPDRHGEWVREARSADAVVLELSDALAAESAVQRLRGEGLGVPLLLVSNDKPGWDVMAAHIGAGTVVLPLPISLPALTASLEALIDRGPVTLPPPPANEEELLSAVAASVGLSIDDAGTLVSDPASPRHHSTVPLPEPVPVAEAEPEPEPVPEPVVEPAPEPVPEPAPAPVPAPVRTLSPAPSSPDDLVAALTARAGELNGVADCAEVAVIELAERVGAEATVLLLPDGDEWRVAAGTGLRPIEHRARLGADHFLVASVTGGEALIADDTDGAREELAGAPLASWPRVLAVGVPGIRGVFVAARHDAPFDEAALRAATAIAAEAAPLLAEALAVRTLARALAPYADLDEQ